MSRDFKVLNGGRSSNLTGREKNAYENGRNEGAISGHFNEIATVKVKDWEEQFDKLFKKELNFFQRLMFNLSDNKIYTVKSMSKVKQSDLLGRYVHEKGNGYVQWWFERSAATLSICIERGVPLQNSEVRTDVILFQPPDTKDLHITEDGAKALLDRACTTSKIIDLHERAFKKCKVHTFKLS